MKLKFFARVGAHSMVVRACALALALPLAAAAQNIAIVNGKPVPKSRMTIFLDQAAKAGQPAGPEMEQRVKDELVMREIFAQEAERQGIAATDAYKGQVELARQSLLIREFFEGWKAKNPVSDADAKTEYDKFKAQAAGTEYLASHILVDDEAVAKDLIAQIKKGAKFEDLAKAKSKDTGSATNGGSLGFSKAESYVPEFGQAMAALKKGEMTETPVKSQFGWHVIRLDDTREASFPEFDAVKDQIKQRIVQVRLQDYQESLRSKAKTDYKFGAQ